MSQGKPLVPILSFGESDMYNLLEIKQGTLLYKVQRVYQQIFGFTVPIFWGRSICGLPTVMPMRRPVHIIIGDSLEVEKYKGDFKTKEGKLAIEESTRSTWRPCRPCS